MRAYVILKATHHSGQNIPELKPEWLSFVLHLTTLVVEHYNKTYQKRHWIALVHRKWQNSIYFQEESCFIFKVPIEPTIKTKAQLLRFTNTSWKTRWRNLSASDMLELSLVSIVPTWLLKGRKLKRASYDPQSLKILHLSYPFLPCINRNAIQRSNFGPSLYKWYHLQTNPQDL